MREEADEMADAWHSRIVRALIGRILPGIVAFGCASNAPHEPPTSREQEPTFANGDFEDGTEGAPPPGWTVTSYMNPGVNYPPLTRAALNLQNGSAFNTFTHVGAGPEMEVDPQLGEGATFRWPKYGTKATIVNENVANRFTNGMTQTQTIVAGDVDPSDGKAHVRFTVAPVLENPSHPPEAQPYYFVELRNLTKGTILYHDFNASAQPGVPWKISSATVCQDYCYYQCYSQNYYYPYNCYNGQTVCYNSCSTQQRYYTDWQLVDIAPGNAGLALGDQVELEVIAAGCAYGGHKGHVWVDGVGAKVPGLFVSAVGPQAQNAGANITYTLSYSNGGTGSASGVKLDFNTPPNTTWVGLIAPGLTCTQPAVGGTGLAQCTLGGLAPGSSGTLEMTVNIDPGATGTITNGNYSIFADGLNPLLGPKVYTEITAGAVYADLSLTKSNGTAGLAWGQAVTYTLVVTNQGPASVSGATVTDTIPAELTATSWTCAGAGGSGCGVPSGTGNLSTTVDLPAGASATFTVTANVVAGSGTGSVTNTASIGVPSGITDSNTGNDIDADTDAIGDLRDVTVSKVGTGFGSVVSAPAAINCGPSCTNASGSFLDGSDIALNAVAALGNVFTGWGGDCVSAGTAAQCNVTLSADLSVTASFSKLLLTDGQVCPDDSECTNGHCVDGVCCNAACPGTCEACDVSGSTGTCSPVSGAPHGSRTACSTDATACGGACDGTNRTTCAYPGAGTACRAASCSSGVATLPAVCNGAGACPALATMLCAPFVCDVSACTIGCTFETDCATNSHCATGECLPDLTPGVACTLDEECLSGHCVDGVCCDAACSDQCEACDASGSAGICTPVSGAPHGARYPCTSDTSACGGFCDGTTTAACAYPDSSVVCRGGSCTAGTATLSATCHGTGTCPPPQTQPCTPFTCGANACLGNCGASTNCSANNFCSAGVCVPTLTAATPCAADDQCQSGHCVDDVCCDTACQGQCEACGVPDEVGTCTPVSGAPHGARAACDSDSSACGGACDGATRGSCAYPDYDVECRAASCAGGAATLPAGCDGLGACPTTQTQLCAPFACGASACQGDCDTDADCNLSSYCSAKVCVPTLDPGTACTNDNQCVSTHCSDSVCCDTGCTGQCEACDAIEAVGTCTPVSGPPHGTRPACDTDSSLCGGACDGATLDACAYPNSDVVCSAASCASGVATLPSVCNSLGGCPAPQTQPCSPFVCGSIACLGDCGTASDCSAGDYCSAGVCVPTLAPATPCGVDEQCESGHCVDGVCCDTACTAQCEACDSAAAAGTCTATSGDPHGARSSCDGAGACAATCDGVTAEGCNLPSSGTECLAATCLDGVARTASLCDGSGVCVAGEGTSCGDYACSGAACLTECTSDDDCAHGTDCISARCVEGSGGAGVGNEAGGADNGTAGEPGGAGAPVSGGGSGGHAGKGGSPAGSGEAGAVAEGGSSGVAGSNAAGRPGATQVPGKSRGKSFEGGGCDCRNAGGHRPSSIGYLLAALGALTLLNRRRRDARSDAKSQRHTGRVSKRLGATLTLGVATLFYATTSQARGFALDRFDPSERGSRFFSADSLDIEGSNRLAAGLVGDFAHKPLVLRDASGHEIAPVIRDQFFIHLGASIILLDRLRLSLNTPLLVFQNATAVIGPTGPVAPSTSPTLGDARLSGDVRLFGRANDAATVALGVRVYLPTGSPAAFTSDGYFSVLPKARLAGRISAFVYATEAGVWVRADRDFANQPVGSELVFGGAAGVIALNDRLVAGPELWASSVISDRSKGFFGRTSTPVELALGAHFDVVPAWRVGAAVGPGLSSGMGSPAARFLLSVEWVPPVAQPPLPTPPPSLPTPIPDRDADGVADVADACPDAMGPAGPEVAKNGCPPPLDSDGDGVADPSDACPKAPGHASEDPQMNGCPLPSAPLTPADNDADGVFDPADACPAEPGTADVDPQKNGCPRAIVTAGEIKILDRVEFEPGKAALRPENDAILSAVAKALKDHPEIKRLSVEGHTDDRGLAAQNVGLSQRRAAAVVAWLVANGIDAARLTSNGFGATRPLESNGAEPGRQANRRVEFKILAARP